MEKLVEVHWLDIVASAGWEKLEDVNPEGMITTGYLVYKDKDVCKIANTKDSKGSWYGIHAIPIGCVKKIRHLSGAHMSRRSVKKDVQNKKSNSNVQYISTDNPHNAV